MSITTHGNLPSTFEEGLKLMIEKPENAEWRRKTQNSFNRMVESYLSLDPETLETLKSINK